MSLLPGGSVWTGARQGGALHLPELPLCPDPAGDLPVSNHAGTAAKWFDRRAALPSIWGSLRG